MSSGQHRPTHHGAQKKRDGEFDLFGQTRSLFNGICHKKDNSRLNIASGFALTKWGFPRKFGKAGCPCQKSAFRSGAAHEKPL